MRGVGGGLLRSLNSPKARGKGRRPPRHRWAVPRPADYSDDRPSLWSQDCAACI